ncbi:MAG: DUF4190 domain-containing protein [Candidatus Heimdallarchaeota archaeon]
MSVEKIYCIYCGATVEKGATFCPNCGAALTDAKPAPSASTEPVSQPVSYQQSSYEQPSVTVVTTPPPPAKTDNSLGTVSMVTGILGLLCMPGILGIVAIITGHIALSRGKNPMAIAGLVLGYISVAGVILYLVLVITLGLWM